MSKDKIDHSKRDMYESFLFEHSKKKNGLYNIEYQLVIDELRKQQHKRYISPNEKYETILLYIMHVIEVYCSDEISTFGISKKEFTRM